MAFFPSVGVRLCPVDAGEERWQRRRHDAGRVPSGLAALHAAESGQHGVACRIDESPGSQPNR